MRRASIKRARPHLKRSTQRLCTGMNGKVFRLTLVSRRNRHPKRKRSVSRRKRGSCKHKISVCEEGSGDNLDQKSLQNVSMASDSEPDSSTDSDGGGSLFTPDMETCFVKLMLQEVLGGQVVGGVFSKNSWRRIKRKFNKHFDNDYTTAQIKDIDTRMKKDFIEFQILKDHKGFGWNAVLQIPQASDEVWAKHLRTKAGKFRFKTLAHYDELFQIFGGKYATGKYSSTSAIPTLNNEIHPQLHGTAGNSSRRPQIRQEPADDTEEEMSMSTRKTGGSNGRMFSGANRPVNKNKKKVRQDDDTAMADFSETNSWRGEKDKALAKLSSIALEFSTPNPPGGDPENVMMELNRLKSWPGVDERVFANALRNLQTPLNRRYFAAMDDEGRVAFMKYFTQTPDTPAGHYDRPVPAASTGGPYVGFSGPGVGQFGGMYGGAGGQFGGNAAASGGNFAGGSGLKMRASNPPHPLFPQSRIKESRQSEGKSVQIQRTPMAYQPTRLYHYYG